MFKFFKNLFSSKYEKKSQEAKMFSMGYDALKIAQKLDAERNDSLALPHYDIAIDCGFNEAYSSRGLILQALDYDIDAIEDFDKAIVITPEDPNIFYSRHLSKNKIGDFVGAIADMEKAVMLSKLPTELNYEYNDEMQKRGYKDATEFFEAWLTRAIIDANRSDDIKRLLKKNVTRRRNNSLN